MYWLYNRPMESTLRWLEARFKGEVLEANVRVLKAGHAFGETTELLPGLLRGPAREDRARRLPQHHRQHGARVGHRRGDACS